MEIVTLFTPSKTRDFALPLDRTDIENEFGLDKIVLSQNNIIVSISNVKSSEKYEVIGDVRGGQVGINTRGSLPLQGESMTNVLISKSDTFHEGFLTKKGKIIKSWKKRWFVIHRGEMSYYKKQLHQSPGNKKATHKTGSFTVEKCLCGPIHVMSDSKEFAFRITTSKRSYFLVASTSQEFELWKEKIILNGGKWHAEKATVLIQDDGSVHIQQQQSPNAPTRTTSKIQITKRRNSGVEKPEVSLPVKVQFAEKEKDSDAKSSSPEEREDMTFYFNKKTGVDFIDIHKGFNKEFKLKSSMDKPPSSTETVIHSEARKNTEYVFNDTSDANEIEVDLTQEVEKTLEQLIPNLILEAKEPKIADDDEIGTFFVGKNSVDMKKVTAEDKEEEEKEENEFPTFVLHRGLDAELRK